MIQDNLVGCAVIQFSRDIAFFQIEQVVIGIEHEFILEDGVGMDLIDMPIFHFFLYDEAMLINIRDKGRLMKIRDVENQMDLGIDVNYSLTVLVSSLMDNQSDKVFLSQFQIYLAGLVNIRQIDLMNGALAKSNFDILLLSIFVEIMQFDSFLKIY